MPLKMMSEPFFPRISESRMVKKAPPDLANQALPAEAGDANGASDYPEIEIRFVDPRG